MAYWGRVLRMAYKARRRTGRGANFFPPERLGRSLRALWIPAVIVWIAQPFIADLWARASMWLRPILFSPWIAWPAALAALACLLLSRVFWKTMGKDWRMGIDPSERNPLIASGPFSRVRHPIYALSMLMMLASAAAVPSPLRVRRAGMRSSLIEKN